MSDIKLHSNGLVSFTSVPNIFIDKYMTNANGEYIKIYLYLLRCMESGNKSFSIMNMADIFEHTETDVLRALHYWEKQELIRLEFDEQKNLTGIGLINPYHISSVNLPSPVLISSEPSESGAVTGPDSPKIHLAGRTSEAPEMHLAGYIMSDSPGSYEAGQFVAQASEVRDRRFISESAQEHRAARFAPGSLELSAAGRREAGSPEVRPPHGGASTSPETSAVGRISPEPAGYAVSVPDKDAYTLEQMEHFQDDEAVQEILFITENYLGRTLNATDIRTIFYWYDGLNLSPDLIEYLIETCISNGHTSLRYMEKIALSWVQNGITSVTQAKAEHAMHTQSVYGVMSAFGISGRNLVPSEIGLVEKWTGKYGFSMDIVKEACRRTISSTGKASFEYADTILTNWHKNHVHNLNDVVKLDTVHRARSAAKTREGKERISVSGSRFHNFPQRSYNYDKLETQLLNTTS